MKYLCLLATLAATSAMATHARAGEIVNVDGTSATGTTVSLGAGTYDVTYAGIAGGGLYNGYALSNNGGVPVQFTDQLSISLGAVTNFNTSATYDFIVNGAQQEYGSAAAALAAYQTALADGTLSYSASYANQDYTSMVDEITFTLASAGQVTFTAPDLYYGDNSGGLSLLVSQTDVPEPASLALLATGLVGMTLLVRRHRSGVQAAG